MDDFEALISSLGEHSVDYIGKDNLRQLAVFGDPGNLSARIEICLEENSWAEQTRAIDRMLELRRMFLDEISIDYAFLNEDSCSSTVAERSDYSLV